MAHLKILLQPLQQQLKIVVIIKHKQKLLLAYTQFIQFKGILHLQRLAHAISTSSLLYFAITFVWLENFSI